MVITNWLQMFRARMWYQSRLDRPRRRRLPQRLHRTAELLEDRTLLSNVAFAVSGPTSVTEDPADGDNNEAEYTISYTGTLGSGETVSVDVAHAFNQTDGADFANTLNSAISDAISGQAGISFDGTTLSFTNSAAGTSSGFAGTVSQASVNGDYSWTNQSNAVGDTPSTYAQVDLDNGDISYQLRLTNFGLNIPANATIDGISVELVTTGSDDPDISPSVQITKNGTSAVPGSVTPSYTGSWSGGALTVGDGSSLWNTTWTPAELNAGGFGVLIELEAPSNGDFFRVYTAEVTVSYTGASAPTELTFTLDIEDDSTPESDETFSIDLSSSDRDGAGTTSITTPSAQTTIVNYSNDVAFSISGPSSITEDPNDGDGNLAEYTISYTGTLATGETAQVDVAHVLNETTSADFDSTLADSIATAASGVTGVSFDGTTLSFTNSPSVTTAGFAGSASQWSVNGDYSWANPTNATGDSPSTYTQVDLDRYDISYQLRLTNFGLSVPANATIDGISVALVTTGSDEPDYSPGVKITKNGSSAVPGSSAPDVTGSWSSGSLTIGNGNSLWNTTWTPAEVNASGFGILIELEAPSNGDIYRVYTAQVSVTYTDSGGSGAPTQLVFSLPITADAVPESDEDYSISLSSPMRIGNGTASIATSSATTTIINVVPPNQAPNAVDDTPTVNQNLAQFIDVLANDSDPEGDPITLVSLTQPTHGVAQIRPNVSDAIWNDWIVNGQGTYGTFDEYYTANHGDPAALTWGVHYTPDTDYTGSDSFTYTIEDDSQDQDTANVSITVQPAVIFSISGSASVTEDPADGDDNEADYTISYTGAVAAGETVSIDVTHVLDETSGADYSDSLATAINDAISGLPGVAFDGTELSFTNALVTGSSSGYAGAASQSPTGDISWTNVANAAGNSPSTSAQIDLDHYDFGDQLRLSNFGLSIPAGATVDGIKVELATTGSDAPESGHGVRLTKNTTQGQGVGVAPTPTGSWTSGSLTFGDETELWSTTWTPAELNSSDFGILIDIEGGGNGDVYHVFTAQVTVYYTDSAGAGVTNTLNFALPIETDSLIEGDESFQITLGNPSRTGSGGAAVITASAETTIVDDPPAPPDAVDDVVNAVAGVPQFIDVLANDTDPDSLAISIVSVTQPTHGTAEIRPNVSDVIWDEWITTGIASHNSFNEFYLANYGDPATLTWGVRYTANAGYNGSDSFTYTITNSVGIADAASVSLTVTAPTGVTFDHDGTSLTVTGTSLDDVIVVRTNAGDVEIVDGPLTISTGIAAASLTALTILGLDGDDEITLEGSWGSTSVLIDGGAGADSLTGGDSDDHLYGGPGNDLLYGGLGADVLFGQEDDDALWGNAPDVDDSTGDYLSVGATDTYQAYPLDTVVFEVTPELTSVQLIDDTATPGDLISSDPRITGTVSNVGSAGSTYDVIFDIDGDGTFESVVTGKSANDTVDFDPRPHVTELGAISVSIRVIERPSIGGAVYGEWDTFTLTWAPNPSVGDVDPDLIELMLLDDETADRTVSLTFEELQDGMADIVFIVDESGSMSTEHGWLDDMIVDLDANLAAQGITDARYALIGYLAEGRQIAMSTSPLSYWGTASEFATATGSLTTNGGTEDGYDGIDLALQNLTFRAGASKHVILVTDENRDDTTPNLTFQDVETSLNAADATLHVIINGALDTVNQTNDALGIDGEGAADTAYFPDGSGGFTEAVGGGVTYTFSTNPDSTASDDHYIDLAFAVGGTAWDLNKLRDQQNPDLAESFTAAFVSRLTDQITAEQLDLVASDPTITIQVSNETVTATGVSYDVQFIGEGVLQVFDLHFVRDTGTGPTVLGSIPVTITPYDILLVENSDFRTSHEYNFTIQPGTQSVEVRFSDLGFDTADADSINDAFELALVDGNGNPLVGTIGAKRDAFFNITEGLPAIYGGGVSYDDQTGIVTLDVQHVPAGTAATLIARLVNNDDDTTTSVVVGALAKQKQSSAVQDPTTATPGLPTILPTTVDFAHLQDVTDSLDVAYERTAYDESDETLFAEVSVTNSGTYDVRGPLLAVVKNIDQPLVRPVGFSGITPGGHAYYDLTKLVGDGTLTPTESVSGWMLRFHNPDQVQFDYEIQFLALLNLAPEIVSTPLLQATVGAAYSYTADAVDPEADPLIWDLIAGPAGMQIDSQTGVVSWTPAAGETGQHYVQIRVTDSYGASDTQTFTLTVVDAVPNRPPTFTSTPVVDAYVGMTYAYPSDAFDPDGDVLTYSVVSGPAGMTIVDPLDGTVTWDPPAELVGQLVSVTLRADDGNGGTAEQDYLIRVHQAIGNHPPIIIGEPPTSYVIPDLVSNPPLGDVTPTIVQLSLAPGESAEETLSLLFTPDEGQYAVDLVFVVDESGSMTDKQDWLQYMLSDLGDELVAQGILDYRIALVGYVDGGTAVLAKTVEPARVLLYGPDGELVRDVWVPDGRSVSAVIDTFELPQDGEYVVVVKNTDGTADNSYSFILEDVPEAVHTTALVPGDVYTGYTREIDERFEYTITLTNSGSLFFSPIRGDSSVVWSLEGPSGRLIDQRPFDLADFGIDLLSGSYTLTVETPGQQSSHFGFRAYNLADNAATLTLGTPIGGTLDSASAADAYVFNAATGDHVFVDVENWTGGAGGGLRLLDPNLDVVFTGTLDSDPGWLTLLHDGSYTLLIDGDPQDPAPTRDYSVNVLTETLASQALTLGSLHADSLDAVAERHEYTFDLGQQAFLWMDSQSAAAGVQWSLRGPAGTYVDQRAFSSGDQLLDLHAGSYVLTVDGAGDAAGSYAFRLVDPATIASALTAGVQQSGTIATAAAAEAFSFNANAGDSFTFDFDSWTGSAGARWTLISPYGDVVFDADFDVDQTGVTLAATGQYLLILTGGPADAASSDYAFTPIFNGNTPPTSYSGTTLTLGTPVSGTLSASNLDDVYEFSLSSRARLSIDVLSQHTSGNQNLNFAWTLIGPAGVVVDHRSFAASDSADVADADLILDLPAGDYAMLVDGISIVNPGNYSFRFLDLAATAVAVTPGTPVNQTLSSPRETQVYKFSATAGDAVYLDSQLWTGTSSAVWRLIGPYGTEVIASGDLNQDLGPLTLAVNGDYLLLIEPTHLQSTAPQVTFNVALGSVSSDPLTFGTVYTSNLTTAGERRGYTFTLSAPARIVFDSHIDSSQIAWSLSSAATGALYSDVPSNDDGQVLNLPAGSYTLTVYGMGAATGAYAFQLLDTAAGASFSPGSAMTGTLTPAQATVVRTFLAEAGARLEFELLNGSQWQDPGNTRWRLLSPLGDALFDTSLFGESPVVTIPQDGEYVLLIDGDILDSETSRDYEFAANILARPTGDSAQPAETVTTQELTPETTYNGAISVAGEKDEYTFTLLSGELVYFDSLTNRGDLDWTLEGPNGVIVDHRALDASDGGRINDADVILNLPAGGYRLTIDGRGSATGSYGFRLLRLDAAASALTLGTPVTSSLVFANQTDVYQFTAIADSTFDFDSQNGSWSGSPHAHWRLVAPDGEIIFNSPITSDRNGQTFTEAGVYTLLIEGAVTDVASAPQYTFNLTEAAAPYALNGTAISLGEVVSGTSSDTTIQYNFSLSTASLVYLDVLNQMSASNSGNWTLKGAGGTYVNQRFFYSSNASTAQDTGLVLLLPAGGYNLEIGNDDGQDPYSFRVISLAAIATALTPGQTVNDNLDGGTVGESRETDAYSFAANAGDKFVFDSLTSPAHAGARWRLVDSAGAVLFAQPLTDDQPELTLAAAGTYYLLIEGSDQDTSTSRAYSFNVSHTGNAPAPVALTLNQIASRSIDVAGGSQAFTFNLASAAKLYFDSLTDSEQFQWSLSGPSGAVVTDRLFDSSDGSDVADQDVVLDLTAGAYTLTVDALTGVTGTFAFRLLDLATAATQLQPGINNTGSLAPAAETDVYSFTARSGDDFSLDPLHWEGTTAPVWRLLDPAGQIILSGSLASAVSGQSLTATGTFTLLVEGAISDTVGWRDYALNVDLDRTATSALPLTLGATMIGSIATAGDTFDYTFTGAVGQKLALDWLSAGSANVRAQLRDPTGVPVFTSYFDPADAPASMPVATLATAGTYHLVVNVMNADTGDFSFRLLDVAQQTALTLDGVTTDDFTTVGEHDVFRFTGVAGQKLILRTNAWVDATDASVMSDRYQTPGGIEDGYLGVQSALDGLHFRPDAAKHVVLITDEDRDISDPDLTFNGMLQALDSRGVTLHTSVFVTMDGALGIDGKTEGSRMFLPDGTGGFTVTTVGPNGVSIVGDGSNPETDEDYVDLAIANGGTVWSLDELEGFQFMTTIVESLNDAFVSILTQEFLEDLEVDLIPSIAGIDYAILNETLTSSGVTYDVRLTGDGLAHSFDFLFVREENPEIVLGSIPVSLSTGYLYDVDALDPDDDPINYELIGSSHGATIDPQTGMLSWAPTQPGDYTFTARVTDGRGGEDLQTWTVTVTEASAGNSDPQLDPAGPFDLQAERPFAVTLSATDPDGDPVRYQVLALNGSPLPSGMVVNTLTGELTWTPTDQQVGEHTVTIRAADGLGGFDTTDVTFYVTPAVPTGTDNHRPDIVSVAPNFAVHGHEYRYDVDAVDLDLDPLRYELVSGPAGMIIDEFTGRVAWVPTDENLEYPETSKSFQAIVRVTDGQGGIALQSWDIFTTIENDVPVITSIPVTVAAAGVPWTYQAVGYDPNGDVLEYALSTLSLSFGATIDSETGFVQWTPPEEGVYDFVVLANDHRGGIDFQQFLLVVSDNSLPQITSMPSHHAIVGQLYEYAVTASDPDPADTVQLSLDAASSARGMVLGQDNVIRWTPVAEGDYQVSVIATDNHDAYQTQTYTLHVRPAGAPNLPPEIFSEPTGPAVRDVEWRYQVLAEDPEGDTLTWSLDTSLIPPAALGDLSINPTTGLISWTPTDFGNYHLTVIVTDPSSAQSQQSFTLTVLENAPPRIVSTPPALRMNTGGNYYYDVDAIDPNPEDNGYLLYQLNTEAYDAGMAINPATGELTWTPTEPGRTEIAIGVFDVLGGFDFQFVELQVVDPLNNTPPVVAPAPRETVALGDSLIHLFDQTDADGDALTYSLVSGPAGMGIRDYGRLYWTPTAAQVGQVYTYTVEVTDDRILTPIQQQFTVEVVTQGINLPPLFTTAPNTNLIADVPFAYDADATDPDGDNVAYAIVSGPAGLTIDADSGLVRWTPQASDVGDHTLSIRAADPYGASTVQTVTLTVRGANRPPQVVAAPPTIGYIGVQYSYDFDATDPDNHTLTYSLGAATTATGTIVLNGQTGQFDWTPDTLGVQTIQIDIVDELGMGIAFVYQVDVLAAPSNNPPQITSTPQLFAEVGVQYQYDVEATDPDPNPTITYTLVQPSPLLANMTFDNQTGLLQWTPDSALVGQLVSFQVQAYDGSATATQWFCIPVPPVNSAPTITPISDRSISAGSFFQLDVQASDPDGDPLEYDLDAASVALGLSVNEYGIINWAPDTGDIGVHTVQVTVSDSRGGSAVDSFDLTVTADVTVPLVSVSASNNPAPIGSNVQVSVWAWDDVGVTSLELTVDGVAVPLDTQGRAWINLDSLTTRTIIATATDAAGNSNSDQLDLVVIDPSDVNDPTAVIITPTPNLVVTEPIDVFGTVADLEGVQSWTLTARPVGGGETKAVASGSTAISEGLLGQFDPTLLRNGRYILELTVTDIGNRVATDTVAIDVEGALKLGNFTLSFIDLQVPAVGIPITVSRTYNTLNSDLDGDFGYGWTLDLSNTQVQVTTPEGDVGLTGYTPFKDGTRVVVTMPDGTTEGFTFYGQPGVTFGPIVANYLPSFIPDFGVTSELIVSSVSLQKEPATGEYYHIGSGATYNPADPTFGGAYELKLRNGTSLAINAETGDLSEVVDLAGNSLTFTGMGIVHSAGRSIQFERDNNDRITAIIDPAGNRIEYDYDFDGNLISVTDRVDAVTEFRYLAGPSDPEHYLDEVIDPLGRSAAKTIYDAEGRIESITDADGKTINYTWNGDSRIQTVTDQLNHTTTIETDARGNVIREVDPEGVTVLRTYDADDNQLTETLVIGQPDNPVNGETDDLTTTFEYNPQGDRIKTIDPRGHSTLATYNQYGQPLTSTDILGNTTQTGYDSRGLPWFITDPLSNVTRFTFDDQGNLETVKDDSGNTLVTNTYSAFGDVLSTTSATGRTTYFAYDINGDQIATWYFDGDPGSETQIISRTFYDEARRVVGTESARLPQGQHVTSGLETAVLDSQYVDSTSATIYNLAGQVVSQTDQYGLTSTSVYDIRGQLIESRRESLDEDDNTVELVSRTVYDAAGRAIAQTDTFVSGATSADGTLTTYDDAGRVIQTRRVTGLKIGLIGSGATQSAVLNDPGTVISSSGTTYDEAGRVTESTDSYGLRTQTTYNAFGEVTQTRREVPNSAGTDAVWLVSRTVYDDFGRVTLTTDQYLEGGADPVFATLTQYDTLGRAHKSTRLEGVSVAIDPITGNASLVASGFALYTTQTIYDAEGRVHQQIAADGQTTTFEYDDLGRQIATISHPLPAEEIGLTGYAPGTLVSLRSETVYDDEGRVAVNRTNIRQIIPPSGPEQTDDTYAQETTYEYDERGNVVKTTFADDTFITATYDNFGRKVTETNQLGQTRSFTYDDAGRLTQVTLPDLDGNAATTTDIAAYQYAYDARGNQTLLVDPLGHETRFAYDHLGRQVSRTLPLGLGADGIFGTADDGNPPEGAFQETMQYDARGRIELAVSFEGVVTLHVYDAYGRLAARQFFDNLTQYGVGTPAETVSYTYDEFGRRVEVASAGRTVTSTYDAQGRLVSEAGPEGTVSYTYDDLGRLTSTIVGTLASPERITSYTYDPLGRLKTVTEDRDATVGTDALLTTTYAYDLLGNLDAEIAPNGVITDYTYDDLNRLDEMVSFVDDGTVNGVYDSGSDTLIAGFDYTLREDGKRTGVTETFGGGLTNTISWDYDPLGRLIEEDFDSSDDNLDYIHTYTFDLAGNRLTWEKDTNHDTNVDETVTYTYDANDRLKTEELDTDGMAGAEQTTTYAYSHTQQTSKTVVEGATTTSVATFSYNLQGRMSQVLTETYTSGSVSHRQRVSFGYDDAGIRVSSMLEIDADANGVYETTTTTTFLSDAQNHTGYSQVLREVTLDDQQAEIRRVEYTLGHDQIGQTVYDSANPGGVTHLFHMDGHGSVRVLADVGAAIVQQYSYDAYGNLLNMAATAALTSYLYSGEQFDANIGQQYLRARWYDPNTGRFNRLDPFFGNLSDPQSFHKYLYTHADPVNGWDFTGWSLIVGNMMAIAGLNHVRTSASEGYGKFYEQQSTSLLAAAAGHNMMTAFFMGVAVAYGPDALIGIARHAAGRAFRIARRAGKQLPGFVAIKGRMILPGPLLRRGGAKLIPHLPAAVRRGMEWSSKSLMTNMLVRAGLAATTKIGGARAHHLIPVSLANHRVLKRIGMDMDHATNGILLDGTIHRGFSSSHRNYNDAIREALDQLDNPGISAQQVRARVYEIQVKMSDAIAEGVLEFRSGFQVSLEDFRKILQ